MSIRTRFKANFLTGLFITVPVVISILALVGLFRFIDGLLAPLLEALLGEHIPGLGFAATLVLVFLIGVVGTNVVGQRLIAFGERLLLRIPIFKNVYTAVKQLIDAFSPANTRAFKQFVLVEYPRKGTYSFGFLTDECVLQRSGRQEHLTAVYIPTNHLYLGEIVLFRRDEVFHPDLSIEEGIRLILSGGTATPALLRERSPAPDMHREAAFTQEAASR